MFKRITPVSSYQGQGLQSARRITPAIGLLVWIGLSAVCLVLELSPVRASAGSRGSSQNPQDLYPLEPRKAIERELSGGGIASGTDRDLEESAVEIAVLPGSVRAPGRMGMNRGEVD